LLERHLGRFHGRVQLLDRRRLVALAVVGGKRPRVEAGDAAPVRQLHIRQDLAAEQLAGELNGGAVGPGRATEVHQRQTCLRCERRANPQRHVGASDQNQARLALVNHRLEHRRDGGGGRQIKLWIIRHEYFVRLSQFRGKRRGFAAQQDRIQRGAHGAGQRAPNPQHFKGDVRDFAPELLGQNEYWICHN